MGQIIGIDYGMKRIGLASAGSGSRLALPIGTVECKEGIQNTIDGLLEFLKERKDIEKYVIGLPNDLDGSQGDMTKRVKAFGTALQDSTGISVEYYDERLTSMMAGALLKEHGMSRKKRSSHIDTTSATLILQNYLDSINL